MTLSLSKILLAFLFCITVMCVKCSGQTKAEIKEAKVMYLSQTNSGLRGIDSLYYEGLKAIRHDRRNIFIRIHNIFTHKYAGKVETDTHGSYVIMGGRKYYKPFKN